MIAPQTTLQFTLNVMQKAKPIDYLDRIDGAMEMTVVFHASCRARHVCHASGPRRSPIKTAYLEALHFSAWHPEHPRARSQK